MNVTRRDFMGLATASAVSFALVGCKTKLESGEGSAKTSDDSEGKTTTQTESSQGNDGKYEVSIDALKKATDYNHSPAVVISFTFTNNGDEAISLSEATRIEVYQDGVELKHTSVNGVDSRDGYTKIKKGKSISANMVYELTSSSPVEVEVYPSYFYTKGKNTEAIVKKTFKLS